MLDELERVVIRLNPVVQYTELIQQPAPGGLDGRKTKQRSTAQPFSWTCSRGRKNKKRIPLELSPHPAILLLLLLYETYLYLPLLTSAEKSSKAGIAWASVSVSVSEAETLARNCVNFTLPCPILLSPSRRRLPDVKEKEEGLLLLWSLGPTR